jgi:hypothetical protein
MSWKLRLGLTWAVLHLLLTVRGAAGLPLPGGLGGRAWAVYDAATGSGSSYGFFAPGVASMPRARMQVTDGDGVATTTVLRHAPACEVDLRIGTAVSMVLHIDEPMRRALAASWAATAFARPKAANFVVRVELLELPTMAEYRAGSRPQWRPYYEASFSRRILP